MKYVVFACLMAGPVFAQDFGPRNTDIVPSSEDLSALILDRDLIYFDDGVSRYNSDGSYVWTYSEANGGGVWEGTYEMTDSIVCLTFVTGVERCDMFVQAGSRLTLLTADGERYPIREIR